MNILSLKMFLLSLQLVKGRSLYIYYKQYYKFFSLADRKFGGEKNSKGFHLLPPYLRIIQVREKNIDFSYSSLKTKRLLLIMKPGICLGPVYMSRYR